MAIATDRIITQIDTALGRYYAQRNVAYYDSDKIGKFALYCSENGLDDDATVEEEFEQNDPADSLIVDFDDDFPGIDANDIKRNLKIFEILENCRENETAYMERNEKYCAFTVTKKDWNISYKEHKNVLKTYSEECPFLFDDKFQEDLSILKLLTVGIKIDEPYLTYLADTFQRERIEHMERQVHFTLPLWQHTNRHLRELKDMNHSDDIMDDTSYGAAVNALHSYFHRVSPQLMFNPPTWIVDSLRDTSEYIAAMIVFVAGLARNQSVSCPFQFDAVFAFKGARKSPHQAPPGSEINDDDDDDDDDEEDDKEEDDEDKFDFYDTFGAIKEKLKKGKLLHIVKEIEDEKVNKGTTTKHRIFKMQYDEFKESEIKKKYGSDSVGFQEYPRKHRFCAVIDRREPNDGDNQGKDITQNDEVIIFEPPDDCNAFPNNKVRALFYFNTAKRCLIPGKGYSDDSEDTSVYVDKKTKYLSQTMTAMSHCNGASMVFTFHVESVDEIRCYLFYKGQHTRFAPEDIVKLLPMYFDPKYEDNEAFLISERARVLVKEMKKNLRDIKFKAFLNRNRSTEKDIKAAKNRYNKFVLQV